MPNIKSAIKRVQVAERNRQRNRVIKSTVKSAVRALKDEVKLDANSEKLTALLNKSYSAIDKAVTKGVIQKNTAARKKARLSAYIRRAKQEAQEA